MRILSRVAIQFKHPSDRYTTYTIRPNQKLLLLDAPDWLADCPLFNWAVSDGSIDVVFTKQKQKQLQNNPIEQILPTGKKVEDEDPEQKFIPTVSVVEQEQAVEGANIVEPKPEVKKTRRKTVKE